MKLLEGAQGAANSEKNTYPFVDLRGHDNMGRVLVTLKVLPEGVDTNLDGITGELEKLGVGKFNNLVKEPIAFGLVALKASYVVDDMGGVSEELEKKICKIEGVRSAEVIDATLV